METQKKLFAFKLAAREDAKQDNKWKAQEGRATAGCTDYRFVGNLRYASATLGADRGVYC